MEHSRIGASLRRSEQSFKPRAQRMAVRLAARVRTPTGWQDARIYNAGPGGIMLRCSFPPKPGTRVMIECGTEKLRGEVRWSDAGKCGIRLDRRLVVPALRDGRLVSGQQGGGALARFLLLFARRTGR